MRALRRAGLALTTLAGAALAALALERVGVTRVIASLLASKPGLVLGGRHPVDVPQQPERLAQRQVPPELRTLAEDKPRYGYRRLGVLLKREGETVNHMV